MGQRLKTEVEAALGAGEPLEPRAGKGGVGDARTEDEGSAALVLAPRFPHALHAALGLDGARELFGIEAAVAPGDVGVVDLVAEAEVVEGDEAAELDAGTEVGAVDLVASKRPPRPLAVPAESLERSTRLTS